MPRVAVYISVVADRELREAGLDPAQIVRDHARKGIAKALDAVRTGTPVAPEMAPPPIVPAADARSRLTRRTPASSLDAVGVSTNAATGKIGTPVVQAAELEDPALE